MLPILHQKSGNQEHTAFNHEVTLFPDSGRMPAQLRHPVVQPLQFQEAAGVASSLQDRHTPMDKPESLPLISTSDCNPVPVYTCHVILNSSDPGGQLQGRTANLSGIAVAGRSERDVLTAIIRRFKEAIRKCAESQQPIPFIDPPEKPCQGESERFIPVHL